MESSGILQLKEFIKFFCVMRFIFEHLPLNSVLPSPILKGASSPQDQKFFSDQDF